MSNTEVKVLNAESSWWETACEGRTLPCNGGLAQLGEHLPYKQGVTGSSPVGPIYDFSKRRPCRCGSMAEQLICNQQVIGSSPIIGSLFESKSMGEFPSGQRGQTVNLLALPSVVRIHLPPLTE